MSIKVSGTTVIDDSRVLQNVTGLKTVTGQSLLGAGDIIPTVNVSANTYTYVNRSSLRSLSPSAGDLAIVEGIGLFVWKQSATDIDDDETCFATASGRWLLEVVNWDFVDAQMPDIPNLYFGTMLNTIVSVSNVSQVTQVITVPGAAPGMPVAVSIEGLTSSHISLYGYCPEPNKVYIVINNPSAAGATLPVANWNVIVFETN